MANHAIESDHVSFRYYQDQEPFLKDINLTVDKGECILICGPSGSGKSTYGRLINGLSPSLVEGELTGHHWTFDLKAGQAPIEDYVPRVGSVFQNPRTQHFTVNTTSELAFPLENMGMDPDLIMEKINSKVKAFKVRRLLDRNIFTLSGGEKQQISFVAANMLDPDLVYLDEITSNLDQGAVDRIRKMIFQLKEEGRTIILTDHRLAWTKDVVDRYLYFEDGRLVYDWPKEEFQALSDKELSKFGLRTLDLTKARANIKSRTEADEGPLQVHNLALGYGREEPIQKHLNLTFPAGAITGIIGENGSGKTTLANALTGLLKPKAGVISWEGKRQSAKDLLEKSFMVMQDINYQLFTESVSEEVLLGAQYPDSKDAVLELLQLKGLEEEHPMRLSEGQKQRVAIASAVLSGKQILIFDEPTSGMDYHNLKRFGTLLEELKDLGIVIIVISHDEELLAARADYILDFNKA